VLDEVLSNGGEAQHLALYCLCLRKTGKQDKKILKRAEHSFCFAPLVLGEMLLRGQCDIELRHNPQIVIEIVCSYIELGLIADANYILNYFEINLPIALYYSAWLNKQLGDYEKAKSQLKTASAIGWRSHFAFRNESGTVLNYALHENPADSNARYHLACLLAYKNHMEKALKLWDEVQGENRTIALRNCGLCYWKALGDKRTAVQYYKHALQNNDVGAKTLIECAALFEECGMNNEITEIFSGRSRMVENDSRLKLALIKAHLLNNKPELAAGLLANGNFSLCEGKMLSRHLYEQTCNALAEQALKNKDFRKAAKFFLKAVEYPENIGIGKPSNNKEAQWFFKAGMVYKQAGYFSEADKCFGHGAERGEFLDINFIPLKNIIWEAQWDKIDIPYWENIIYRMHCLRCLDKNCQAKELSDKINRYLAFLDSSGRKGSPEYIKLSTLTNLRIKI
jgi:tetratricopeptide (TPR) repeat protein